MKKEIVGGMTEQEARSLLFRSGVRAFKELAGSLPQKDAEITNFEDFPTFSVWYNSYYYNYDYKYVVRAYQLWLRCDEPLCCDCADCIEVFIQPDFSGLRQVHIVGTYDDSSICAVCGKVCRDDIPF